MGHIFLHLSMGQIARICQNDFTIYQIEFNIFPLSRKGFLVKVLFCIFYLISKTYRKCKDNNGSSWCHCPNINITQTHSSSGLLSPGQTGISKHKKKICTTREEQIVKQLTDFICIAGWIRPGEMCGWYWELKFYKENWVSSDIYIIFPLLCPDFLSRTDIWCSCLLILLMRFEELSI